VNIAHLPQYGTEVLYRQQAAAESCDNH